MSDHDIEVQATPEGGEVLRVDGEPVPFGRLPDGQYFLDDYAYDWADDLRELAARWVAHRERADAIRRAG